MMTPKIRKAASFHRVDRDDLEQCIALAQVECERDEALDLERQVLRALNQFSKRSEVRTVSIDDESNNVEAIELEALEQQDVVDNLEELAHQARLAAAGAELPKAIRGFLTRLSGGTINHSDAHRWLPRVAEIRAILEGVA